MWKEPIIERKEMYKMSSIRQEHYKQTSLECFDVLRIALGKERFIGFCLGNAIKYLWRHEHKNGYEDIEKAGVYLDKVDELISDDSTSCMDSELYEALSSIHPHELEKHKERTE